MAMLLAVLSALVAATALSARRSAQSDGLNRQRQPSGSLTVLIPCANNGEGRGCDLNGELHVLVTFTINGNNRTQARTTSSQGLSDRTVSGGQVSGKRVLSRRNQFKGSFQNGQFDQSS